MLRALFFDWHGVLDKKTFSGMVEILIQNQKNRDELISKFRAGYADFATGKNPPATIWNDLRRKFGDEPVKKSQDYIFKIDKNKELWKLLPKLKKKYGLFVLSDCSKDKEKIILAAIKLKTHFTKWYFSCDYNLTKKNKAFFRIPLNENHLRPDECLFIDDSPISLEYAKNIGMKTHLFKTAVKLEKFLLNESD